MRKHGSSHLRREFGINDNRMIKANNLQPFNMKETKIIWFVCPIGVMVAFHKYVGCVITMEEEEMLKQKEKTGTKLNAYKLYIKKKMYCVDLYLCKMFYALCRVGFKFPYSFDFHIFPLYIIGGCLDRVELGS